METGSQKPLAFVEAMGVYALPTGIEVKLLRSLRTTELGEPRQKGGAVSARTTFGNRDEVVDVKVTTPSEVLAQMKASYCDRLARIA